MCEISLDKILRRDMYYTGVGRRNTPRYVLELMEEIGVILAKQGYTLRTGNARGADAAFRKNVPNNKKEVYGPVDYEESAYKEEIIKLITKARGSLNGLSEMGIALHGRNTFQVLGRYLDKPSSFLIFWSPPIGNKGLVEGGTNTTVQLAIQQNIKTYNLHDEKVFNMFRKRVDSLTKNS